jgi:L-amino acid N-acyltransferase
MLVRDATRDDLPQILAIYNEVIATSTAIYADRPVSLADRAEWFEGRLKRNYPVLVAVEAEEVLGFLSFGDWRGAWSAYRHTVEHSVHVSAAGRGGGVGSRLVEALFPLAQKMNMHVMIGAIDAANERLVAFP